MLKPVVSIIVPVFNVAQYLERNINSLRNQTLKDIEIILVNDGSTDESLAICKKYETLDDRIKVYSQVNQGVSSARNKGLELATGQYVGFIDPDDWIEINMYEELLTTAYRDKTEIVMSEYMLHKKKSDIIYINFDDKIPNKLERYNIKENLIKNMLGPQNLNQGTESILGSVCRTLFKRELLVRNSHQFLLEFSLMEDLIFIIDILLKVDSISIVKKGLYHYEMRNQSAVNKYRESFLEDNIKVFNELQKIFELNNLTLDFQEIMNNRFVTIYLSTFENLTSNKNPDNFLKKMHALDLYCSNHKLRMILTELDYNNYIFRKKFLFNSIINNKKYRIYAYYYLLTRLKKLIIEV